ncbi:hypothetical protein [Bacteroides coprosuis]|uniref:hypothetical protein n=1 Tax=Bacteroides coprosuis TaxID=151276 RepID=UPI001DF1551B|nr:hypothetical protein [Bacteroides coprosuis]HJD92464.1 hypothetical protein [Bacteroides coprosuis]
MEKSKRSLNELLEGEIEDFTEEEKESFRKMNEAFSKFSKSIKAYEGIDIKNNNNTAKSIFKRQSNEYYVMAIVLESFFYNRKEEVSFKELNYIIYTFAPKDMVWDTSVAFVNAIIGKMIFLSLVKPIKTDKENILNFKITEEGVKALQDHRFQNLAVTAFSNYQSYRINKVLLRISRQSLLIAGISAIIAVFAIIISIVK